MKRPPRINHGYIEQKPRCNLGERKWLREAAAPKPEPPLALSERETDWRNFRASIEPEIAAKLPPEIEGPVKWNRERRDWKRGQL